MGPRRRMHATASHRAYLLQPKRDRSAKASKEGTTQEGRWVTMYTADVIMHALYTAACVRHVMKPCGATSCKSGRLHADERVEADVRARRRVQMRPECQKLIYTVHGRQTAHQCRLWRTRRVAADRRLAGRAVPRRHQVRADVHQGHTGHAKGAVRQVGHRERTEAKHHRVQAVLLPDHRWVPVYAPKRHVKEQTRATQSQVGTHEPPRSVQTTMHGPVPQITEQKRAQTHHAERLVHVKAIRRRY